MNATTNLAEALGGEWPATLLLCNHAIELAYRRAQDKRYLERFLERPALLAAVEALERPESDAWALHFIGTGGVGKTMLLRFLSSDEARPDRGPVACIDFDYLSPDFPVRKPGQLLLELAHDLRLYGSTTGNEADFDEFQGRMLALHESLSTDPAVGHLEFLNTEVWQGALTAFASLISSLRRPVLFILDTCEELAKLQPVNASLPSVEATFAILEAVHQQVPTIRVVLAGRRLLARGGHGWEIDPQRQPEGIQYLPEARSYLRLVQIRGFDRAEVDEFWRECAGLDPTPTMREAILEHSEEDVPELPVHWHDEHASDKGKRFRPFDLDLYADWLRDDPTLTPELIANSTGDPYIERRIVGRLKRDELRSVLPAVALLRRFNKVMLQPAVAAGELDEVFRELGDQEWIAYQPDDTTGTVYLEVDRNLQPRLLQYFHQDEYRARLEQAAGLLAPWLRELVSQPKVDTLQWDLVDAALRLLPTPEGALLWDEIERRAVAAGAWSWAEQVVPRLLESAVGRSGSAYRIRAALRATLNAALVCRYRDYDAGASWREVATAAADHPDDAIRRHLQWRAELGQVAALRNLSVLPPAADLRGFWPLAAEVALATVRLDSEHALQLAAAAVASVEALIELVERHAAEDSNAVAIWLNSWIRSLPKAGASDSSVAAVRQLLRLSEHDANIGLNRALDYLVPWLSAIAQSELPSELLAFSYTLAARWLLVVDQRRAGERLLDEAVRVLALQGPPAPQFWLDWRAPDSLLDRVGLEVARMQRRRMAWANTTLQRARVRWERAFRSIDVDRLASQQLQNVLVWRAIPRDRLARMVAAEAYVPGFKPTCLAHTATPPFFATVAMGWLALGDGQRAFSLADRHQNVATDQSDDNETLRAAGLAKLEIVRRLRHRKRALGLIEPSVRAADAREYAAAQALVALTLGASGGIFHEVTANEGAGRVHGWWRAQSALTHEAASAAVAHLGELGPPEAVGAPSMNAASIAAELDWQEGALIAEHWGLTFSARDFL